MRAFQRFSGTCGGPLPNCARRFRQLVTGARRRLEERIPSLSSHEHYEELCALAATGQISRSQRIDLEAHMAYCPDCRQMLGDFNAVGIELIKAGFERNSTEGIPDGMIERVVERARLQASDTSDKSNGWHSRGLRLLPSQRPVAGVKPRGRSVLRKYVLSTAVASFVIAAFFLGTRWERDRFQSGELRARPAIDLRKESSQAMEGNVEQLQNELKSVAARETQLSAVSRERERDLDASRRREADLEARISALERPSTELEKKKSNDDDEIARLKQELERSRSESEADRKHAALAEAEILELRATLNTVSQKLAEATRLNSTFAEVRDLLTEPNVHVWNVHDTDEKGKTQKAFGRLIYAEGNRLTFYAFDLLDRKHLNSQIAFYVWGEKAGTREPVRNLGVLQLDDERQGRWKLAFDNHDVLAEIDGIFVTAEPAKGFATEPRGKRMLFASLDPNANRP